MVSVQYIKLFDQNSITQIQIDMLHLHLYRFSVDFGQEKDILKWVLNYLDATRAGLLTHLLSDGGPVNIAYQNYDWSGNL